MHRPQAAAAVRAIEPHGELDLAATSAERSLQITFRLPRQPDVAVTMRCAGIDIAATDLPAVTRWQSQGTYRSGSRSQSIDTTLHGCALPGRPLQLQGRARLPDGSHIELDLAWRRAPR